MKTTKWINGLIERGLVCDKYKDKIAKALSKKQIMDVFLDANGIPFLCEMSISGDALPYEVILSEFKSYINGRYSSCRGEIGHEYTSAVYCCYSDSNGLDIDTTQTLFLGCSLNVNVKPNDYVRIYLDKGSDIRIHCPESSKCIVENWGGVVSAIGSVENVRIKNNS